MLRFFLLFMTLLVAMFGLVTGLWLRTEARHRGLGAARRIGRIASGLGVVVIATPVAVLMPMFWLDEQLPAEAGLRAMRSGIMALVLITLVLVGLVNAVGALVIGGRAVLGQRRPPRPDGEVPGAAAGTDR